ncbi:MAG: 3'-5' exonuclease domain-containing protein 2 [Rikenellaceae bacterium]|nr:3'-5' exonuclease domain-containing protein 2 [Rikenellaceae bacterium]
MEMTHAFQSTISNDETAQLPAAQFPGEIVVVERDEEIRAACEELAREAVIGFDTETRPSFKAGVHYRVALLQLSTPKRCFLFRLCHIPLDKAILHLLENPQIKKVGAAVHGDLSALKELRHFREAGFVDLQKIVEEWGIEEKSLRKMSALVLGMRISKAQRLSNWEATSLTPQQQMYAATDAWICGCIYDKLNQTPKSDKKRKA